VSDITLASFFVLNCSLLKRVETIPSRQDDSSDSRSQLKHLLLTRTEEICIYDISLYYRRKVSSKCSPDLVKDCCFSGALPPHRPHSLTLYFTTLQGDPYTCSICTNTPPQDGLNIFNIPILLHANSLSLGPKPFVRLSAT
jgi:hypothetical protein